MSESPWLIAALWVGLALLAALVSIRTAISVALVELVIGAGAGNAIPWIGSLIGTPAKLEITPWINFLAGAGAIILTFLAGAEIDPAVVRKHFWSSMTIGTVGFFAPFFGVLAFTHYVSGWPWPQAEIAGIALSTTSVAVVYAVMIETGFNRTEMGKIILAACFVNDLGTVLALALLFANYNLWMVVFLATLGVSLWLLPRFAPWFFAKVGNRVSEPESKFILLALFALGGLGNIARSEAVLPAYLVGMVLAPYFLKERVLAQRLRVMAFTFLTPFYFLKAGSLVKASTVVAALGLIAVLLGVKMLTKFLGIWPLTKGFRFSKREGMYTTLLMSTGLTFGSISALFGLTNGIINQDQYTVLVTAVIGSALVPTLIAQKWFQPEHVLSEETDHGVQEDSARPGRVPGIVQGVGARA
jgi:Kef-type K+ transport system membrane component KefB